MPAPAGIPRSGWEANQMCPPPPRRYVLDTRTYLRRFGQAIDMHYRNMRLVTWAPDGSISLRLTSALPRAALQRIDAALPEDWSIAYAQRHGGRLRPGGLLYRGVVRYGFGSILLTADGGLQFGFSPSPTAYLSTAELDGEVSAAVGHGVSRRRRVR